MRNSDVIFTPIFCGTTYKYHICSGCNYTLRVGQSIYGGPYFEKTDSIKYCPSCGESVIRFEKDPIYKTQIDFEPMRLFYEEREMYERRLRWLYYCVLDHERTVEIEKLMPFAEKSGPYGWVKIAHDAIKIAKRYKTDWRAKSKLIKEFGQPKEAAK